MRKLKLSELLILAVLLILLTPSLIISQSKFEGKVIFAFKDNEGSKDMTYFAKDNQFRMELSEAGHQGTVIYSPKKEKMLLLMPEQKMYMEFPFNMMKNQEGKMKKNEDKTDFKNTGETKKINGYKCEKWIFKDDNEVSVAWMTKELGGFVFMDSPMEGNSQKPEWQQEIEAAGYFPMLVINKNNSGDEISRLVVKSIQKEKLDSSLFTVPEGFTKMDMPMMNPDKKK